MAESAPAAVSPLEGKNAIMQEIYERLLEALRAIGPFREEPKKTSFHLAHTVGFAGVHPRKDYLYPNLRSDAPIANAWVHKTEQMTRNRHHNEIKLTAPGDVDAEPIGWLKAAYAPS